MPQSTAAEEFATLRDGRRLCYQCFGPEDGTPLLLVGGLGMQMVAWRETLALAHTAGTSSSRLRTLRVNPRVQTVCGARP